MNSLVAFNKRASWGDVPKQGSPNSLFWGGRLSSFIRKEGETLVRRVRKFVEVNSGRIGYAMTVAALSDFSNGAAWRPDRPFVRRCRYPFCGSRVCSGAESCFEEGSRDYLGLKAKWQMTDNDPYRAKSRTIRPFIRGEISSCRFFKIARRVLRSALAPVLKRRCARALPRTALVCLE